MSKTELFEIVSLLSHLLPIATTVGFLCLLPSSWQFKYKALASLIIAWTFTVLYTINIYNPSGIAMGLEQGLDSLENHFDNNTTSVSILIGWVYPLLTCLLFYAGKIVSLIYKVRKKQNLVKSHIRVKRR